MFEIVYHSEVVRRDIPKLSAPVRTRIRHSIETRLSTQPDLYGKPLRRSLHGYHKLRVGDYRVIFTIDDAQVKILMIAHRSIVYRDVAKRV